MGGSGGLAAAPAITQTSREEEPGEQVQLLTFRNAHRNYNKTNKTMSQGKMRTYL